MSRWDVKKVDTQEELTPNLIPMVDIMFLLLLFLMLGADMGQRELEDVLLPNAEHVKEDKQKDNASKISERFTVNVYHLYPSGREAVKCEAYAKRLVCRDPTHWRIAIKGKPYKTATDENFKKALKVEADVGKKSPTDRVSERKVMLRVDGSAPYGLAQGVMNACAFAGLYKIEAGAAVKVIRGKVKE